MRGWRAALLAWPLAVTALLVAPVPSPPGGVVLAHAQLVAGAPGPGEVVTQAPDEIRLVFSERLETQVTSLDLVGPDGAAILTRAGTIDPGDPFALVEELPPLADGAYTVRWRTLSSADGHIVEGSFSFGVGDPASVGALGGSDVEAAAGTPPEIAARFVVYAGLMAALGMAVFHAQVVRAGPMPPLLASVLATALGAAAVASLALPVLDGLQSGSLVETLTGTRNGILALARAAVAAAGALGMLIVAPRGRTAIATSAGLLGLALHVSAGHAAGVPSAMAIAGQVVHVGAAAVWLGGIGSLLLATVAPRALGGAAVPPPLGTLIPRFSALALASIGLVGVSGVLAAWTLTGSLLDPDTAYGRTLALKLIIATGALALGGLNYLDGGRRRGWLLGVPARLRGEVTLALGVLIVTAMLSTTTPTDQVEGVEIAPVPDIFGQVMPDVSMQLVPGRPGVNRLLVGTTDALASASLELAVELNRLDVAGTTRVPLRPALGESPTEDGVARWTADAQALPAGSAWDASVLVTADTGAVLSRQRFAFVIDDEGVGEGGIVDLVEPRMLIAATLLISGALAMGLGLGRAQLPRTDAATSRVALLVGGAVATLLGIGIGVDRLIRLVS